MVEKLIYFYGGLLEENPAPAPLRQSQNPRALI
jgi:hypothetical protein